MIMNLIIINRIINTECKGGSEFYKNVNVTIDFITWRFSKVMYEIKKEIGIWKHAKLKKIIHNLSSNFTY